MLAFSYSGPLLLFSQFPFHLFPSISEPCLWAAPLNHEAHLSIFSEYSRHNPSFCRSSLRGHCFLSSPTSSTVISHPRGLELSSTHWSMGNCARRQLQYFPAYFCQSSSLLKTTQSLNSLEPHLNQLPMCQQTKFESFLTGERDCCRMQAVKEQQKMRWIHQLKFVFISSFHVWSLNAGYCANDSIQSWHLMWVFLFFNMILSVFVNERVTN